MVNGGEQEGANNRQGLRERQRAQRDEAILSAVLHLLAQKHYEAMTMDDVAERAGISKPTLYQYYHSKEAVTVRAMIGLLDQTTQEIRDFEAGVSALQRIERLVRATISRRPGSRWRAFFNAKSTLLPVLQRDPGFRAASERYHGAVSEIIDAARAEGEIDPEISTDLLLIVISRLLVADEYDALVAGKATASDVADVIIRILKWGIRPQQCRCA